MALVIAVVGVFGTLTAPMLTQSIAARAREAEAESRRRDRAQERADEERRSALAEKRAVYVELNAVARQFRTASHDRLRAARRGVSPLPDVEEARQAFRVAYSKAQMIMPDRTLAVVAEANLCLTHGYRLVKDLTVDDLAESTREWFEGPMMEAVQMLRAALREDLGVAEPISDIDDQVSRLRAARSDLPVETS